MKTKNILTVFAILSVNLAIISDANATGGISSGGGDSVVCYANSEEGRNTLNLVKQRIQERRSDPTLPSPFSDPAHPEWVDRIESVESFDLFEYRRPNPFTGQRKPVLEFQENEALQEFVINRVIRRVYEKSYFGDTLLLTVRREIPLENWVLTEGLPEIDDSMHLGDVPGNCALVQVAAQQNNRVEVVRNLFEKMSKIHQAALVLHELAYYVGMQLHHDNSPPYSLEK